MLLHALVHYAWSLLFFQPGPENTASVQLADERLTTSDRVVYDFKAEETATFQQTFDSNLKGNSLLDDILNKFKHAVDCDSCHALLVPLSLLADLGDGAFVGTLKAVCQSLKLEDKDVCGGTLGQQGPILANDLRKVSKSGEMGTKICDAVLGLCQPPAVNPYTVKFPKSAPTNPKVWKSTGKPPFQAVHFSDVHIDRSYTVGAEADCKKPICCRKYADQKGAVIQSAGPNGHQKCDTPTTLSDSMLKAIGDFGGSYKFSIFTGDVVEADVWLVNKDETMSDIQEFNNDMATKLNATVFPSIGNHEIAPINAFPRNTSPSKSNTDYLFNLESKGWEKWIGSVSASQVTHYSGSYSSVVSGTNLRIISLNTNYWYKQNFWLYDSNKFQPDPNGILAFLVQELQTTEDAGQRAWIIGHLPPGIHDTLLDQSNYFNQVIQRYKNTIAGTFYGHTHSDQFEIAYSDYSRRTADNAVSIAWIAPALTPRGANPGFKIYDVDPDTYEIMDAHVYSTDVTQSTLTWKKYYSARESYGPLVGKLAPTDSLNPSFWHKVTEAFESNDSAFQMYNSFLTRGLNVGACTGACKTTTICDLRAMRAENSCDVSSPKVPSLGGTSVRRRHRSHRDCEGTGITHILTNFNVEANNGISKTSLNTIAQEVRKVAPEVVAPRH